MPERRNSTLSDIINALNGADANGDGRLTEREWETLRNGSFRDPAMKEAAHVLFNNLMGQGATSVELRVAQSDAADHFHRLDANHDGMGSDSEILRHTTAFDRTSSRGR